MSTQPLLQTQTQKRIALPGKIEPKVYFANERTFLSWLHFSIIVSAISVGLFNFGEDRVSKTSAGVFLIVAILIMLYALFIYHWRAANINRRESYDDRYGPTILCVLLLGAMVTNFTLRVMDKN